MHTPARGLILAISIFWLRWLREREYAYHFNAKMLPAFVELFPPLFS